MNAGGLLWFYHDDDLRRHTYTYEPVEPDTARGDAPKKRRKLDEDKVQRLKERTEERKTAQLREEVRRLEAVKLEMEAHLDAKLEELLADEDLQLDDKGRDALNEEAAALLEDVRAQREAVAFVDGRAKQVESTLESMVEMNVLTQTEAFIGAALRSAEALADSPAKLSRKAPPPGETFDPFDDDAWEEVSLPAQDAETLAALSQRARDLADKAEALRTVPYAELFDAGQSLEALQPETLETLDANDLYAYAQALEAAIFDDVNVHQAADLALVGSGNFDEALEAVASSAPARPDLTQALTDNQPTTAEGLLAFHNSLEQAVGETTQMRVSAQSRLNTVQARTSVGTQGRQLTLARQNMLALSAQQGSRGFADYSQQLQAMQQLQVQLGGGSGYTHDTRNTTLDQGTGAGIGQGGATPQNLRLPENRIKREAMPGRRFTRDSIRQGWLFLDSWYIIGPWEKERGEITFNPPYPPEAVIDLDAQYPGKEFRGQPIALRWRFLQSDSVRITPYEHTGNSVYYAYTEVYAEVAMEALLAVASDDGAKIWLNDVVVHQDSGLSPWRLDEGFRKVYLQQGFNRVLLRVENGPSVCHFSVLLCPVELAGG
ncbi:MAG: hypothetical protein ACFB20_09775 [Opitutales bacterium]